MREGVAGIRKWWDRVSYDEDYLRLWSRGSCCRRLDLDVTRLGDVKVHLKKR